MGDLEQVIKLANEYKRLVKASEKACQDRARLDAGSTRARVTTANARWAIMAEARERVFTDLTKAMTTWLQANGGTEI